MSLPEQAGASEWCLGMRDMLHKDVVWTASTASLMNMWPPLKDPHHQDSAVSIQGRTKRYSSHSQLWGLWKLQPDTTIHL